MMNTLLAVVAVYKNLRSRELVINTANYQLSCQSSQKFGETDMRDLSRFN